MVVGAGPAGSCTATLLARAGHAVLLLDRSRFPRDKPCSESLSPAAARILDRLGAGVLDRIERSAHARLAGWKIVAPGGAVAIGRFGTSARYPGVALPRTTLDTILRDAAVAEGVEVREGVTVEDLTYDHGSVGGVVARTGDGSRETHRARVVVGADGLRSIVARRLGLRRASRPRRLAFAAHVAGVAGVREVGEMHVGRSGYVGLGPIGDGVSTVALVVPQRAVRERRADLRTDFFAELDRFPGLRGRFEGGVLVREVLVTGPFAQWSRSVVAPGGGALLVGDAADFFDPFTGQGIYSALRGAELAFETLAAALARPGAGPVSRHALAPYARARRRAFAGKWVLERLIGLGVGWPALVDRVVERMARRPALADLLVGAAGNFVPARAVLAPATLAGLLL
ncbi:MAG: NAD(P)/FAD-dependent oxidoreductase [Gemmatimonadales bacterium]